MITRGAICGLMTILALTSVSGAQSPIDIGSRLQLMVDDYLVDSISADLRFELHPPVPGDVGIVHDAPWEGNVSGYHTVFKDGDTYRMYYRGLHDDRPFGGSGFTHREVICYAESTDGINWTKPDLDIVEFDGSTANNIIWDGHGSHSFSAFRDGNPSVSPDAQYKAVAYSKKSPGGIYLFKSPDAIHWTKIGREGSIPAGDAQPVAFWDSTREQYVMFHKKNRPDPNAVKGAWLDIATATSDDFDNWSSSTQLQYPGSPDQHMYTNAITPYYRAPDVFMGLPCRMLRDRYWDNEEIPHDQVSDAVFMTSRDGQNFNRWSEAIIRPGPEDWDWQHWGGHINNMPAAGIVETKWGPDGNYKELSIYAVEGYFFPEDGNRLRRYTQRIDGFVSVQAPLAGGEFVTRPIVFNGSQLAINFSTSGVGSVRAEVQDAEGNPIEGFSLADCPEIFGDSLERTVSWAGGSNLSGLAGQPVRLRFVMSDADLYSFRFSSGPEAPRDGPLVITHNGSVVQSYDFDDDTAGGPPSWSQTAGPWHAKNNGTWSANNKVLDGSGEDDPDPPPGSAQYLLLDRADNFGSDGRAYLSDFAGGDITSGTAAASFLLYIPSTNDVSATNSGEGNIGLGPSLSGGLYLTIGTENASGQYNIDYWDHNSSSWKDTTLDYAYDTWQQWDITVDLDTGDATLTVGTFSADFNIGRTGFTVDRVEFEGGWAGSGASAHNKMYIDTIPEPSTLAMLVAGGLAVAAFYRRRRKK